MDVRAEQTSRLGGQWCIPMKWGHSFLFVVDKRTPVALVIGLSGAAAATTSSENPLYAIYTGQNSPRGLNIKIIYYIKYYIYIIYLKFQL
jgi:hypothetical protein